MQADGKRVGRAAAVVIPLFSKKGVGGGRAEVSGLDGGGQDKAG